MSQIGRHFRLADEPGAGVFCGLNGMFVGAVPLLERHRDSNGTEAWQPRPAHDLNRDLRNCYGMPVDVEGKMSGLSAICRALNRGDLIHAQIATLHLQIPDPPRMEKSGPTGSSPVDLTRSLQASGLLKVEWDEEKHPRWPAGSPDSVGGQFAPVDAGVGSPQPVASETAPIIQAQATIAVPLESPILVPRIPPIPLAPSDISPRDLPQNPYPDRPEREQEWAEAYRRCFEYLRKGLLGAGSHRGMGKFLYQCILGQVSEDCGGNPKSRGYPDQET